MTRSESSNTLENVQKSLDRVQGLASAPQLLLQIKEQLEEATRMSEELADEYHRAQARLKVQEKMVKIALSLGGYSDAMIEELQRELESE